MKQLRQSPREESYIKGQVDAVFVFCFFILVKKKNMNQIELSILTGIRYCHCWLREGGNIQNQNIHTPSQINEKLRYYSL